MKVAALVIGLVAGYYLFTVGQVWWEGRSDHARGADAIVVLGAAQYDGRPSPQLASRLDHALDLYRRGTAPLVVLTGGKRPGDRFTEAQAGERYLEDRGVPASAIAREDSGTTSFESIQHAATLLKGRGLRRVVLVSDPFHSLRIRLSAEEVGLVAVTSPTRTSPVGGRLAVEKHFKEAVGVAIGRIIGFSRLPT